MAKICQITGKKPITGKGFSFEQKVQKGFRTKFANKTILCS